MTHTQNKKALVSLVATIVVALLAGPAAADTVTVGSVLVTREARLVSDPGFTPFVPSGTDLANAGQPSLVGVVSDPAVANLYRANDGTMGTDDDGWYRPHDRDVTFTLSDPAGYDIYEISSFQGYTGHVSYGRQAWNVSYSVVGDDGFLPLLDVPFQPDQHPTYVNTSDYSKVSLTSTTAGDPLATNVDQVRIEFAAQITLWGPNNNWQREVDIFGEVSQDASAIPEPATLVMLGVGGLVALRRRRRA